MRNSYWRYHERSVILSRLLIADNIGRKYRDIDLKGIGRIIAQDIVEGKRYKIGVSNELGQKIGNANYNWNGLLHKDVADYDRDMNEKFLSAGIRAPRVLAIINLEEIFFAGRKYSVDEMKNDGVIDKEAIPVIEVRAFRTKFRIKDFISAISRKQIKTAELLIDDARELVSEELGREDVMSHEEYFRWFRRTLGENVGLMHENGWYHKYLTSHNITLDCRIVDFDSVREHDSDDQIAEELHEVSTLLCNFCFHYNNFGDIVGAVVCTGSNSEKTLLKEFKEGYISARHVNEYSDFFRVMFGSRDMV